MMDWLWWVLFVAVISGLFAVPRVYFRLRYGHWPDQHWGEESKEFDLRDW
jgi:hypothetical protein